MTEPPRRDDRLRPEVLEMLNDPNHFRYHEMQCVDYSNDPPPDDGPWLPSFGTPPASKPTLRQRFRAALRALVE